MNYLQDSVDVLSKWVQENTKTNEPAPRFPLDTALIMVNDGIRREGLENLVLLNYHPTAAFRGANKWLDIERVARGLIFEKETGELVARPFIKFHNYSEDPNDYNIKSTDIESLAYKEDGSLGICFFYNNQWWVSTHGSLTSDQGVYATNLLRNKNTSLLDTHVTVMAEIVYPENRIVTNYGDVSDLIYLNAFSLDANKSVTSEYVDYIKQNVFTYNSVYQTQTTFDITNENVIQDILDFCETQPDFNFEGFVLTLKSGRMIKFKTKAYLDVHRCRFDVSLKRVKELMIDSPDVLVDWKATLPNEFFDDVERYIQMITIYANEGINIVQDAMLNWYKEYNINNSMPIKDISRTLYPCIATLPLHLQSTAWSYVKGKEYVDLYKQVMGTYAV